MHDTHKSSVGHRSEAVILRYMGQAWWTMRDGVGSEHAEAAALAGS
jgi:hypothetical protein